MNRRRRRLLVTLATLIVALLPLLLAIGTSYLLASRDAQSRRENYALVALQRAERILDAADATLRSLASQVDRQCTAKTLAALGKASYDSLYFRKIGLVQDQALQCSGDGLLRPALPLLKLEPGPLPRVLRIVPPLRLLPAESSIGAVYGLGDGLALALLINPAEFGESLLPILERQQVAVLIAGRDSARLARFGWQFDRAQDNVGDLQSIALNSSRFPIRAIATTSRDWLWQTWKQQLPSFASLGLALSALLFFLGNKLLLRQFSLDAELYDALANDEFEVHYQPVLDVGSGACLGAEALIRWRHPRRGLVLPDSFMPIAEDTGFVVPLTAWLMQRIVDDMGSLLHAHPRFHISMNLSARHILDPGLIDTIVKSFTGDATPHRIIFEITEQELLRGDHAALVDVVRRLHETGARLALDDFGTGYSSLKYLTQFRFDYLKIDKVFVQAIGIDPVNAGLVDVIVDIARRLRLEVVAEGIETTAQRDYAKNLGIRMVQGWLYSKALPAPALRQFVLSRESGTSDAPPG